MPGKATQVSIFSRTPLIRSLTTEPESLCHFALVTAHPEFLSVLQKDEMIAVEPRVNFFHEPDIDDGRAMNSQKVFRVQLAFEAGQRFADIITASLCVYRTVAARRLDTLNFPCGWPKVFTTYPKLI
jgi:hypothetical protein